MATIRDFLDHFIGRAVVDITSHDPGVDPSDAGFIMLMFDDGSYVQFPMGDDAEMKFSTANNCLDHAGCISAEDPIPDPALVIHVAHITDLFIHDDPDCPLCLGSGHVCEDHPDSPWRGGECCGAAGMPCPKRTGHGTVITNCEGVDR